MITFPSLSRKPRQGQYRKHVRIKALKGKTLTGSNFRDWMSSDPAS